MWNIFVTLEAYKSVCILFSTNVLFLVLCVLPAADMYLVFIIS